MECHAVALKRIGTPIVEPAGISLHGPTKPSQMLYGIAHLRRIMNLSDAVTIEQLCEDAALRIVELQVKRFPRI